MKDQIISLIRTFVPIAVGSFIGWLTLRTGIAVPDEASNGLTLFFVAILSGLYYTLARALEAKWPWFGLLLGAPAQPVYLGSQKGKRVSPMNENYALGYSDGINAAVKGNRTDPIVHMDAVSAYPLEVNSSYGKRKRYFELADRQKLDLVRELIDANEARTVVNTSEIRRILESGDLIDDEAAARPWVVSDVTRERPVTSHKLTREERQAQQDAEQQAREDRD